MASSIIASHPVNYVPMACDFDERKVVRTTEVATTTATQCACAPKWALLDLMISKYSFCEFANTLQWIVCTAMENCALKHERWTDLQLFQFASYHRRLLSFRPAGCHFIMQQVSSSSRGEKAHTVDWQQLTPDITFQTASRARNIFITNFISKIVRNRHV